MKPLRYTIIAILAILAGFPVIAQSAPQYELRTPSLSDFLDTAQSVLHHSDLDDAYKSDLVQVLDQEFTFRYRATATYKEYQAAFDVLKIELSGTPPVEYPRIDLEEWVAGIVNAWLAENPIDLDSMKELRFDDFQATIEQRDFNNDGKHEWLLDLTKGADGNDFEYRNWMVIAREGNSYRAIPIPIWPGYHGDWDFPTAYSQQPQETDFKDITGDGIPEWFIGRDISPWGNIPGQSRDESILSWQDGQIVNLAPQSYGISMANLDDDPALELFTDYWLVDSWGCSTNSKTVYDWDGQAFTALGQPVKEKRNCEARDAEEAMWRGDFQSALRSYEAFFEANGKLYHEYTSCILSPDGVECNYNYGVDRIAIYNYFLSRRIIAYIQLSDQQNIDKSLAALREAPYPDAFGQAILALNSSDPQKICKAAYAFFTNKTVDYGSFNEYSIFTPGEIYEDIGQYNLNLPIGLGQDRDPLKAGCDMTIFSSEPTPTPTATSTPAPTYTPYPTPTVERELLNDFPLLRFRDGDYEAVIWISDHVHERFSRFTDDSLQMHYWKGLALEALARPQEALDTYTAVAKEAPDSVWAELARLHFQCTAGC